MTHSSSLAMRRYSTEPRIRKYVKGHGFLSFAKKYRKQLLDTRLEALKTASKKGFHKTGDFIGNKNAAAVTKLYNDKSVKVKKQKKQNKY